MSKVINKNSKKKKTKKKKNTPTKQQNSVRQFKTFAKIKYTEVNLNATKIVIKKILSKDFYLILKIYKRNRRDKKMLKIRDSFF